MKKTKFAQSEGFYRNPMTGEEMAWKEVKKSKKRPNYYEDEDEYDDRPRRRVPQYCEVPARQGLSVGQCILVGIGAFIAVWLLIMLISAATAPRPTYVISDNGGGCSKEEAIGTAVVLGAGFIADVVDNHRERRAERIERRHERREARHHRHEERRRHRD